MGADDSRRPDDVRRPHTRLMKVLVAVLLLMSTRASADGDGRARRLQEATMERRVFRQISVGLITYPSRRLTWVLYRGDDEARLELFCQDGDRTPTKGIQLDGRELDEAYWKEPQVARFAGRRVKPLAYELRREEAPKDGTARCAHLPEVVTLGCVNARISVRPAGARLVPGRAADPEAMPPPTWRPATQQKVAALRCQANDSEEPLIFATPGVEWVYENSDMVVQEGGYRRLTP